MESIPEDEWTHLVAVINGDQISLYQNGILAGNIQLEELVMYTGGIEITPIDQVTGSESGIIVGAYVQTTPEYNSSNEFSGLIESVTTYDSALSASEISDLYQTTEPDPVQASAGTALTDYTLEHSEILPNQSVSWELQVSFSEETPVTAVELPDDAEINYVKIIDANQNEVVLFDSSVNDGDIESNTIDNLSMLDSLETQDILAQKEILGDTDVFIIDQDLVTLASLQEVPELLQEGELTKILVIGQMGTNFIVQFETPSAQTTEVDQSTESQFNKEVTVESDSTLHYSDVKTCSDLPEDLVEQGVEFNLFWEIDGEQVDVTNDPEFAVDYNDTDGNGINDQMCWIVPQLSSQTFNIVANITIINVQSFPVVGGEWVVRFTTEGTADLIITAIDGTTFGDSLPDDLKFLELNDGSQTLTPIISGNTITYPNYSSDLEGFERSLVLTSGKHHLKFQFGNDIEFANNTTTFLVAIDDATIAKSIDPNNFSEDDVNEGIKGEGVRTILRYFSDDVTFGHIGDTIDLSTGSTSDAGIFSIETIPASWANQPAASGLDNFLGGTVIQADLDPIPDVIPQGVIQLNQLVGHEICGIVYASDVSVNFSEGVFTGNLQGATLGIVAFTLDSVAADPGGGELPDITITIADAAVICVDGIVSPPAAPTITITKDSGAFEDTFEWTLDGPSTPTLTIDTSSTTTTGAIDITAGTYTSLTEDALAGWTKTSTTECTIDGGPAFDPSSGFTIAVEESLVCDYVNVSDEEDTGTIIIIKDVDPEPDATDFGYTSTGGLTPATFDLDDDLGGGGDEATLSDTRTFIVAPGLYTVTEDDPSATHTLTGLLCVDSGVDNSSETFGTRTANISLETDETVTCTFTNEPSATTANLSLTKGVSASTPNVGDNITYTIVVSNAGPDSATNVLVEDNLLAGVTFVSDNPTQGTYDDGTGIWTVGTIISGGSALETTIV